MFTILIGWCTRATIEGRFLRKLVFALELAIISALCLVGVSGLALGANASFTLEPLKEHEVTLSLQETDSVSGSFSIASNDETGINFIVTDPYNNIVLRYDNVLQKSFSFTVKVDGDHQLHFDNSLSAVNRKTVSLNYDVIHYIMGLPQEQFLLIVIAVVAVVGLVLYAVLMPR